MLPFWGDPAYLYAAVDSVLAQDGDDWHLTIVDDQYPDESVAAHFADLTDPRVTYLRNEVNLGVNGNFRRCLELAGDDYLMFMGCDDLLRPGFVAAIRDAVREFPGADIFEVGVAAIDEHGQTYVPLSDRVKGLLRPTAKAPRVLSGEQLATSLLHGDWLYWPSLVFRTELIRGFSFGEFELILDLGIILDLVTAGASLVVLPQELFAYRRHAESASSAQLLDGRRFADERSFFAAQARRMAALGWHRAARAARAHLTSRAYAVTLFPKAIAARSPEAVRALAHHVVASN